jgi:hypothetical protein
MGGNPAVVHPYLVLGPGGSPSRHGRPLQHLPVRKRRRLLTGQNLDATI